MYELKIFFLEQLANELILRFPYDYDFVNHLSLFTILFALLNFLSFDNLDILKCHVIIAVVFDLTELLILLLVQFFFDDI